MVLPMKLKAKITKVVGEEEIVTETEADDEELSKLSVTPGYVVRIQPPMTGCPMALVAPPEEGGWQKAGPLNRMVVAK
jgi:hypothetical protein